MKGIKISYKKVSISGYHYISVMMGEGTNLTSQLHQVETELPDAYIIEGGIRVCKSLVIE